MRETTFKRSMAALAVATSFGLSMPSALHAQEQEQEENLELEKITVTGSRVRRDEFASPSPIQVISVVDAKRAGITNVADMLQRISLVNGTQIDNTINTNSGNSNATEAPPAGGVGSVNVGLRGLGAERTLVLLNGTRLGASGVRGAPSQPDMSLIPLDMVDRVEVLSDSASAVYGADAVAGVINIILKQSFDGFQISADVSTPSDDGGEERQLSFVTGGEGERFKFIFGGEFYERERITLGSRIDCIKRREINAETGEVYEYCYNGFPDNAVLSTTADSGSIWNFYTPGQSNLINPLTGQPVDNFSTSENIPDVWSDRYSFLGEQSGLDRFRLNPDYNDNNDRLASDLVSPTTRFSLMSSGTYFPEWGEANNIAISFDTSYFHRHLTNRASTEQIYPGVPALIPQENEQGNIMLNDDGSRVMVANPLNPFGTDALPIYTIDNKKQTRDVELDHFRFSTGISGDLPGEWAKDNFWNFNVNLSYDRGDGAASQPLIDERNFIFALETLRLDSDGNLKCGVPIIANNPWGGIISAQDCVVVDFLNQSLFGNSNGSTGALSDEAAAYLIGERVNRTVVTQSLLSGYVSGDLFSFENGGAASLVLGVESRRDAIDSQVDFLGANGLLVAEDPGTEGVTAGARTINEIFGEISLPVLREVEGAHELTVDLAMRYTDESNFGSESTERVRITYSPLDWISLSAAYGTSFRTPNLREQYLGDQFGGESGGIDPCNASPYLSGEPAVYDPSLDTRSQVTLDNCVLSGANPFVLGTTGSTNIPIRVGGSVDSLLPETSDQTTLTLKATPISNEDLSFDFSVTYFDIQIENTIQQQSAAFIMTRCFEDLPGLASPFCNNVGPRNPNLGESTRFISSVDASFVNIGEETSKGYDINTRLGLNFDDYDIVWTVQATIQDERSQTIIKDEALPNGGKDDFVGTFGTPELRLVTQLSVNMGDFTLAYSGRFIDETSVFIRDLAGSSSNCLARNAGQSAATIIGDPTVYRDCVAESAYYSDISLTWTPNESFSTTAGIRNFTDEQPAQVSSGLGNDRGGRMTGSGYDQVGRTMFLSAKYKF
ncbi:TonB-dependent receptor domain-containing protein [Alteromonas facilis]|uniref:TonB-dependent receptor domain-containing protein n=1 Tax=Alteromonas facilis TaxID=2048004 RepID=UPI000C2898BC|nr:TonB-dependent receptor [Alteromonas facilis]